MLWLVFASHQNGTILAGTVVSAAVCAVVDCLSMISVDAELMKRVDNADSCYIFEDEDNVEDEVDKDYVLEEDADEVDSNNCFVDTQEEKSCQHCLKNKNK